MNPTLYEYLGFVVAALILGWAIVEISRRYFRQRKVTVGLRRMIKENDYYEAPLFAIKK